MTNTSHNTQKNKAHYNKRYADVNIKNIIHKLDYLDEFLQEATTTDTSWVCMYWGGFETQLKGKKVLELGCGDCTNAAVMAALGAEVWANDISDKSGEIIQQLNQHKQFDHPIHFVQGNFLKADTLNHTFDIVIGKAFVHHLTHEQEVLFIKKIVKVVKPEGMVRFVEPAVNSKLLDTLRWVIPVSGRPSSLQRQKFKQWQHADPHPKRDNSSTHYKTVGLQFFEQVVIVPVGGIERLHRFFPKASWNRKFRRLAFKMERYLPEFLQFYLARTQTIDYRIPKK